MKTRLIVLMVTIVCSQHVFATTTDIVKFNNESGGNVTLSCDMYRSTPQYMQKLYTSITIPSLTTKSVTVMDRPISHYVCDIPLSYDFCATVTVDINFGLHPGNQNIRMNIGYVNKEQNIINFPTFYKSGYHNFGKWIIKVNTAFQGRLYSNIIITASKVSEGAL